MTPETFAVLVGSPLPPPSALNCSKEITALESQKCKFPQGCARQYFDFLAVIIGQCSPEPLITRKFCPFKSDVSWFAIHCRICGIKGFYYRQTRGVLALPMPRLSSTCLNLFSQF